MILRLLCLLTFPVAVMLGADASPTSSPEPKAAAGPLAKSTLDKRTDGALRSLKVGDAATEAKAREVLQRYFQAIASWHEKNDAKLTELWTRWADARATAHKDEAKAAEVGKEIDQLYQDFRPQHDGYLAELGKVLTADQIEALKNALTRSPGLERTYEAYLQIVPTLKDEEKRFIREKLLVAREEAMDTFADKEKVNLFKKQKVQVEAFIDAHGYDWKTSYAAFAAKVKGDAKPAAATPGK